MNVFTTPALIIITCPKRLAPWLQQEVLALGFEIDETFITGIRLKGTVNDCIRLNLNLRCASQVLYHLKSFTATEPDDIYKEVANMEWEKILPADSYFSITSNVNHPTINNSMFANLRVKDALVDRIRNQTGSRPQTGAQLSGAVIHLHWKHNDASIFIDTSGESLARHGYRKIPGQAPMLEALAAATIYASQWDRQSPFVNPMCGSGTLAIEAAMIATNRKPGLSRNNYAFMHLTGYDEAIYEAADAQLEAQITEIITTPIIATDYSTRAIENAKKNAVAAGVANIIDFEVCDFAKTKIPAQKGVVFLNPEYGERLGNETELQTTYKKIGDFFKQQCKGYYGYIFTGNLELAKSIGLKAKRRVEFYNSTIDCRLLEYELYEGSKKIVN